ncbi:unnamed protein product [Paramecium pentaurelia]|uniref:Uncharacterized protein n=1 Tax=Paramecium pentaurelia TaxID=43138 RepID=A0A8S1SLJ0_9CILI|nr:unnamed protein product [Paramecium pentaurelia]
MIVIENEIELDLRGRDFLRCDTFLLKNHSVTTHQEIKREFNKILKKKSILLKITKIYYQSRNMIIDATSLISNARKDGRRILTKGANAIMLNIDYVTYPYVTQSSTNVDGVFKGLRILLFKLLKKRRKNFSTQLSNESGKMGHEFDKYWKTSSQMQLARYCYFKIFNLNQKTFINQSYQIRYLSFGQKK